VLQDLQLEAAWNLVSFKMDPLDAAPSVMFASEGASRSSNAVWYWDAASKTYIYPEELVGGTGYWVYVVAPLALTAVPGGPAADVVRSVPSGWSLVGPVGSGTGRALPDAASGVAGYVWTWDALAQGYEVAQSLAAGLGHWVYCSAAAEVDLGTE